MKGGKTNKEGYLKDIDYFLQQGGNRDEKMPQNAFMGGNFKTKKGLTFHF